MGEMRLQCLFSFVLLLKQSYPLSPTKYWIFQRIAQLLFIKDAGSDFIDYSSTNKESIQKNIPPEIKQLGNSKA